MGWDKPPTRFAMTIEEDVEKLSNVIVLNIHRNLVFGSAVDTGRYRGNHVISINRKTTQPINFLSKTPQSAVSDGFQRLAKGKGKPFRIVWIANNVPYAMHLEHNHRQFAGNYARAFNNAVIKYT